MDWVFLFIGSVYFIEVFLRLNSINHIKSLQDILSKVTKVIRSPRISDHWKERALPRYSLLLLKQSLLIFAVFLTSFAIFPLLGFISELLGGQFIDLTTSVMGVAASSGIAISYAAVRSRTSSSVEEYGVGSRILHQISLGTPFVGEALFDLEKSLYASKLKDEATDRHVFVCGLARAGTTVLMRRLYEGGQFCSLTYRDMPFVLSPNLWRKLCGTSIRNIEVQERAHGDGLLVDYDSPEALEEVFWRTYCGSDYISNDYLVPMSASVEVLEDFRTYVALILKDYTDKRYLSKNNNNIVRLESISGAFPNSTILVPFRQPYQQAYSLMNQHQRFTQLHSADGFAKKYMTWLVHHEFGADHRPFRFDEKKPQTGNPNELGYWLKVWINAYTYISDHLPDNAFLVCYETLCDDNDLVWIKLAERINVLPHTGTLTFSASTHEINYSSTNGVFEHANELYMHMRSKAIA